MFTSLKSIGRDARQDSAIFDEHIPTSQLFGAILGDAPKDRVTLAWLFGGLRQRSFGIVMLLLGMIAMVPGVSIIAAFLLVIFGFQMLMAREAPVLPRFIGRQSLSTHRIAGFIARVLPVIKFFEKFIWPRWHTPFKATKRVVGFSLLLLAGTLFMPLPLSNVIPAALIMLVAFAYLEEDGVLLCIALVASLASLAITGAEAWGAIMGAGVLLRR